VNVYVCVRVLRVNVYPSLFDAGARGYPTLRSDYVAAYQTPLPAKASALRMPGSV
jgi:hypothetical protein